MKFWTFAIFYILVFFTGTFVTFCSIGFYRDRNDLIAEIEGEIKDLPRDKDIRALEAMIPNRPFVEDEDEQVLQNPEDFKMNMG